MTDHLTPRLLIPDNTPLSLLSMMGKDALDWPFMLGAEVWVTDMVLAEAVRDPGPGADQRRDQRRALREWFKENGGRIRVLTTEEGANYKREMRNWEGAGRKPEDRPSWSDRGERSMQQAVGLASSLVSKGEALVLLVDDRDARTLMVVAAQTNQLDADIMSTQTFLDILERDFGLIEASTAWQAITLATASKIPAPYEPDPILLRPRSKV